MWSREEVAHALGSVCHPVGRTRLERLQLAVGHPLAEEYLEFLTARARPNTRLAVAFDLKVFFSVVDKTCASRVLMSSRSSVASARVGRSPSSRRSPACSAPTLSWPASSGLRRERPECHGFRAVGVTAVPADDESGGFATTAIVAVDLPLRAGHFPGFPIFPGVCLIERAHQTALLAAAREGRDVELDTIGSTRFLEPTFPGDRVRTTTRFADVDDGWCCWATVDTDHGTVAEVRLRCREPAAR